ncbi:MAG: DNA repair protein RecO [Candidatus Cloacimonetes bacterium]|nr:DNA repair protein RecO [Candidatus Cloacimonadota bacterium]
MKKVKLQGILIKQSEYSDSSLILRFLSKEQGIIGVIAKGIRKQTEKQQLNNLCEYNLGLYEPKEAGLWLLYEHDWVRDYTEYTSPATWAAAECGLELISQMVVSPEENLQLYELTLSYLDYLQGVSANAVLIFWRLWLRLLRFSGVGSPLDACCCCHKPLSLYNVIDLQNSGLICRPCINDLHNMDSLVFLSPTSAEILRLMPEIGKHINEIKICKQELTEINSLLEKYWDCHYKQTLKLKSLSVLSQFYS